MGFLLVEASLGARKVVQGGIPEEEREGRGDSSAIIGGILPSFRPGGLDHHRRIASLRFWEYQSVNTSGNPIDVSRRIAGSTQISATEAASTRNPSVVLAGWNPQ
jgi:hypothetical protein